MLDASPLLILRDRQSQQLLQLFQNPYGKLSNINAYINSWSKHRFRRDRFLQAISSTLDRLIDELDIDVMYTVT